MEGHMRLTGQSQMSLLSLHYNGGTFEIDQSISIVPNMLRRLDPYGGTFEIDWSISLFCESKRRLDINVF